MTQRKKITSFFKVIVFKNSQCENIPIYMYIILVVNDTILLGAAAVRAASRLAEETKRELGKETETKPKPKAESKASTSKADDTPDKPVSFHRQKGTWRLILFEELISFQQCLGLFQTFPAFLWKWGIYTTKRIG